ncbi:hypothetical protein M8C21_016031 [Ambrosia artemisiifolia]|uniref:Uncharacterized protein n=1 Tax=Ambrosia artemisiifolia TaxID=4212 RepID=A0AAD5CQQ4_AMBAR|nr:hypothetical protein M8C21_016031 [Ambrosia artemisiifolia]
MREILAMAKQRSVWIGLDKGNFKEIDGISELEFSIKVTVLHRCPGLTMDLDAKLWQAVVDRLHWLARPICHVPALQSESAKSSLKVSILWKNGFGNGYE